MADRQRIDDVIAACERYWRSSGVSKDAVDEMTVELASHLEESAAAGRSVAEVVGPDLPAFAEQWATEVRRGPRQLDWAEATATRRKLVTVPNVAAMVATVVVAALVIAFVDEGGSMDEELWRWIWVGLAFVLGVGEILTAGFFILPFAVGAVVAAILAWIGAAIGVQWGAFLVVSVAALIYMRRFVPSKEDQLPVGANRFDGARAVVLETVDDHAGTGRVRMDTEEWRAVTNGPVITEGTPVRVVGVRGSRLVVEPWD